MSTWVIVKVLAPYTGIAAGKKVMPQVNLYWAGPHWPKQPHRLEHMSLWVWLTDFDPRVAHFATRDEAQSAAEDFAGPPWQGPDMDIVHVHFPAPPHGAVRAADATARRP